jgi:hypothetical protein
MGSADRGCGDGCAVWRGCCLGCWCDVSDYVWREGKWKRGGKTMEWEG